MKAAYIFYGICRAADDELFAQDLPGFIYGHVVFAQMYPVGSGLAHNFHMIINNECSSMLPAKGQGCARLPG